MSDPCALFWEKLGEMQFDNSLRGDIVPNLIEHSTKFD